MVRFPTCTRTVRFSCPQAPAEKFRSAISIYRRNMQANGDAIRIRVSPPMAAALSLVHRTQATAGRCTSSKSA